MKDVTIYHNARCTKSRATLELLEKRGIKPRIVEYLKDTPTAAELKAVLRKLGIKPEALVRKGEDVFKQKYAGKQLTDAQWIDAMIADPILIERPIVVTEGEAAIGRPPENVVRILR